MAQSEWPTRTKDHAHAHARGHGQRWLQLQLQLQLQEAPLWELSVPVEVVAAAELPNMAYCDPPRSFREPIYESLLLLWLRMPVSQQEK